ncbi:hypothetical protein PVK06_040642 [Gossypium arboreum]|uniref:Uncharacterized protein n=1 Tax=Gossypium arboreum TaxID=29729 RepID=A0ABR0N623_GOSAR|nr:hypothetical protein PVK06_040642 [Gossypium arboreum]
MEVTDSIVDGNRQTVQNENIAKDLYKPKLMGVSLEPDVNISMEKEFVLQDEDVDTKKVDRIPSIIFLDLVHRYWKNNWTCDSYHAHTDSAAKGRFSMLTINVDMNKPLVSKIRINGRLQRVEYEGLLNICFMCGLYGLSMVLCSGSKSTMTRDVVVQGGSKVEKLGLQARKLAISSARKEGVTDHRDFGVRKIAVKSKGVSVSLEPKASGRVLKPNNSGVGFSSKKVVSGSVVRDLMGRVSKDGSLGQENFKVVSLKPNLDKPKHMSFRAIEVGVHGVGSGKENILFKF